MTFRAVRTGISAIAVLFCSSVTFSQTISPARRLYRLDVPTVQECAVQLAKPGFLTGMEAGQPPAHIGADGHLVITALKSRVYIPTGKTIELAPSILKPISSPSSCLRR